MENQSSQNIQSSSQTFHVSYFMCPKHKHEKELKFVMQKDMPNLQELYCSSCLIEKTSQLKGKSIEIMNLDFVFTEILKNSKKFSEELNPIIDEFQKKQEQISKNDFKAMFESLISKREEFRKIMTKFRSDIDVLCNNFERLFDKRLESLFYESLIAIESKLSSFKQTFEILRLKLTAYSQDLASIFQSVDNVETFKQHVSMVLKDLKSIKESRLIKLMNKGIHSAPMNSHIAESFTNNRELELELTALTDNVISTMTQKYIDLQQRLKNLNMKFEKNLNTTQPDLEQLSKSKDIQSLKKNLTEPLLVKEGSSHSADPSTKEEFSRLDHTVHRLEGKPQTIWADPADESIEVFEREIARYYEQERAKNGGRADQPGLRLNVVLEEKYLKKDPAKAEKNDQEDDKLRKYANSLMLKAQGKGKPEESGSDAEYVSDDENEKELDDITLEREIRRHLHSKATTEPRIFKRIMKSKKPNSRIKGKEIENEIAKFSKMLLERPPKKKSGIGKEDDENVFIFVNNGKQVVAEPKEVKRAFKEQLIQYLTVKEPDEEAQEKIAELVPKIEVNYKNRKVDISTIIQVEETVGEFLRSYFSKEIIKYRIERRKLWDRDAATNYEDVCREFLFKYYNMFKGIKRVLLRKLNVSKDLFNDSKKIWIDKGHVELLWYGFKAKAQKTPAVLHKTISEDELGEILEEVNLLMKETLEKYMAQFKDKTKREKHYFYEIVSARIFDQIYKAYQVEEEDILYSLTAHDEITNEENQRLYEEIENTVVRLVFPEYKIVIKGDESDT